MLFLAFLLPRVTYSSPCPSVNPTSPSCYVHEQSMRNHLVYKSRPSNGDMRHRFRQRCVVLLLLISRLVTLQQPSAFFYVIMSADQTTTPSPLATSRATAQTSVKDARNQSVFAAGNGRFFASVRTGGSTRFLGTFNSSVDANQAVESYVASSGAKLEPNFQFY